jgi:hypothetical protein
MILNRAPRRGFTSMTHGVCMILCMGFACVIRLFVRRGTAPRDIPRRLVQSAEVSLVLGVYEDPRGTAGSSGPVGC